MQCPSLKELPLPLIDKKGWPWTESFPYHKNSYQGDKCPLVSIVTPSYNQGRFIEETIRSVLLQGYPNLEYIIIDGGSSDNSVEIIKKYEPWLTYWISEKDYGQAHAINKGFEQASGKVFGWLNSDDYYCPGGIATLINWMRIHPDCVAWAGACQDVDINGNRLRRRFPVTGNKEQFGNWSKKAWIPQPSCLFDATAFKEVGKLDESLHFVMDVDLWMRLADRGKFISTQKIISNARMYSGIKTRRDLPMQQAEHILINFKQGLPETARSRMARCMEFYLDAMAYRKLLKYFMKRTVAWLWQSFRWLCGK